MPVSGTFDMDVASFGMLIGALESAPMERDVRVLQEVKR
jgi:hypothetical protein